MSKKAYEDAEFEIMEIQVEDIINVSDGGETGTKGYDLPFVGA